MELIPVRSLPCSWEEVKEDLKDLEPIRDQQKENRHLKHHRLDMDVVMHSDKITIRIDIFFNIFTSYSLSKYFFYISIN